MPWAALPPSASAGAAAAAAAQPVQQLAGSARLQHRAAIHLQHRAAVHLQYSWRYGPPPCQPTHLLVLSSMMPIFRLLPKAAKNLAKAPAASSAFFFSSSLCSAAAASAARGRQRGAARGCRQGRCECGAQGRMPPQPSPQVAAGADPLPCTHAPPSPCLPAFPGHPPFSPSSFSSSPFLAALTSASASFLIMSIALRTSFFLITFRPAGGRWEMREEHRGEAANSSCFHQQPLFLPRPACLPLITDKNKSLSPRHAHPGVQPTQRSSATQGSSPPRARLPTHTPTHSLTLVELQHLA